MRAARDAHPAELAAEGVTVVVVLLVLVVVSIYSVVSTYIVERRHRLTSR